MRLEKLQLVIDEHLPMRIKPDSLIFLVKRKLQDHYVLLNRRHMLRERHTTRHMVPFRDWCPICVASRGRGSPHRRVVVNKTADTLPELRSENSARLMEHVAPSTNLCRTVLLRCTSAVSVAFGRKFGQCRKVPAAVCSEPQRQTDNNTCGLQPCSVWNGATKKQSVTICAKKSHQSNGFVEAVHGHIQGLARCYQIQIATNTGIQLSPIPLAILLQFVTLDLCSQDSQCDPTAEPHSNICLELHMYHLCACLVNRYLL